MPPGQGSRCQACVTISDDVSCASLWRAASRQPRLWNYIFVWTGRHKKHMHIIFARLGESNLKRKHQKLNTQDLSHHYHHSLTLSLTHPLTHSPARTTTMSGANSSLAYSGGPPSQYPLTNIFDFVFGNPFEHESHSVPASQRIPHIDDRRPIFVDNKSGKSLLTCLPLPRPDEFS